MARGRHRSCHFDRGPSSCHPERSRGIWLRMEGAPRPQSDVSATLRSARHDKRNEFTNREALSKATGRPPSCHPERSRGIWLRMGGAPRPQADVSATLCSARHDKRNEFTNREALSKATGGPQTGSPDSGRTRQEGAAAMRWRICPRTMGHDHAYRRAICGAVPAAADSLSRRARPRFVIPAKAGIHLAGYFPARGFWIPAHSAIAQGRLRRNDRVSLGDSALFRRSARAPVAFPGRLAAALRPHPDRNRVVSH